MEITGKISKKADDLRFGFVTAKGSEEIFFSPETAFVGVSFDHLKIGDKVRVQFEETSRGLFATSLNFVEDKNTNKNSGSEINL
jgi:cold shock CspA family protein